MDFVKKSLSMKCRESNKICFDEFYSLSFQEANEMLSEIRKEPKRQLLCKET